MSNDLPLAGHPRRRVHPHGHGPDLRHGARRPRRRSRSRSSRSERATTPAACRAPAPASSRCSTATRRASQSTCKTPEGLALVKRLVAGADVVTENFRPGALDKHGLGYDTLCADNPRLDLLLATRASCPGPYEHRTALDEVVQMMGGLAYMTGPPGRPLRAGTWSTTSWAACSAPSACWPRCRSGTARAAARYPQRAVREQRVPGGAAHGAVRRDRHTRRADADPRLRVGRLRRLQTSDGEQIFLGAVSDTQWRLFCDAFGLADLMADQALATNPKRVAARERFMPRLRAMFASRHARRERSGV